jgi:type IV pilus assembly protein PilQ
VILLFAAALMVASAMAQTQSQLRRAAQGKEGASADEVVSFRADVPFEQAIKSLGELWKSKAGKIVVDRSGPKESDKQVGVNIEAMYWKDAFELILRSNKFWYNQFEEHVEVVTLEEAGRPSQTDTKTVEQAKTSGVPTVTPPTPTQAPATQIAAKVDSAEFYFKEREITISSIFFEVDRTKLAQTGIGFSIFRGKGLNLGIEFSGADRISTPILSANLNPRDKRLAVDIDAALNVFESEQLGEVIARPQITVRNGTSSKLQSGQNFSVQLRDFSGNVVNTFYETGTILTVMPKVWKFQDKEFISLSYKIERSTPLPSATSIFVNKTEASGNLMLLDGEEAYVGGLYSTEESITREGVPVLKDLPWWVFGLRYLFGYDATNYKKKELVVLMRAQMVPLLEDRLKAGPAQQTLENALKDINQDLQKRTTQKKVQ